MGSARPAGSGLAGKRPLYLIQGDDPYRARLRAAELVAALATGDARPSDLRAQRTVDLGTRLGLTRHDARAADVDAISELAAAVGTDSERIDQELAKLGAFAAGARVTGTDVRALVSGAIETDIFDLAQAVVRHDSRVALQRLETLLAEGQAAQQILALLLWQFRVLLFASAMKTTADAERMAKAIRSSAYAIGKWQAFARRVARADVIRAYEVLYATDLAIKTGRIEERLAMTLCVLDLCGVHAADPRELVVGEPPRR